MFVLIYNQDFGEKKKGDIHLVLRSAFDPANHNMDILSCIEIPDQDIAHTTDDEDNFVGTIDDLVQYTIEERAAIIDRQTGLSISSVLHQFSGIEEQIGILRDHMARMLNGDMTPSEDFKRLNEIAIAEIEKARIEKEAI